MRTIVAVEVASLDLPLTEPFSISGGTDTQAEIVVVKVTLADGTEGLGEAAPFPAYDGQTREAVLSALSAASPGLLGVDTLAIHQINEMIIDCAPGSFCALTALEMACLDGFCKSEGIPVWKHFGSADARLSTDITIVVGDQDHAARSASQAALKGFRVLKIKVGRDGVAVDVDRMKAVHEAAPHCDFVLDANGGFTCDEARELIDIVSAEKLPVLCFEQPLDPLDESGASELVSLGKIPIIADESCKSAADAMRIIQHRLADGINIKTQKSGILEANKIIDLATSANIPLMIGGMVESVLSMSFSAHLARARGCFRYVDLDTPLFIREHPFLGGIDVVASDVCFDDVRSGHSVVMGDDEVDWQELVRE